VLDTEIAVQGERFGISARLPNRNSESQGTASKVLVEVLSPYASVQLGVFPKTLQLHFDYGVDCKLTNNSLHWARCVKDHALHIGIAENGATKLKLLRSVQDRFGKARFN